MPKTGIRLQEVVLSRRRQPLSIIHQTDISPLSQKGWGGEGTLVDGGGGGVHNLWCMKVSRPTTVKVEVFSLPIFLRFSV